MRRSIAFLASVVALVAVTVGTSATTVADSELLGPTDHCDAGAASSIANAFYPLFWNADGNAAVVADRCQFRAFIQPSAGICFDEYDRFVGGVVLFDTRAERAFLEGAEVTIAVVDPDGVETEFVETPIKGSNHPVLGPVLWKQWALIFEGLAPGSYWVVTSFGGTAADFGHHEVVFHVLDHEVAHDLGRPTSSVEGSVVCPS
jgi:hypothetical protein